MKFEEFNQTDEVGKLVTSQMVETTISQGSKRDAHEPIINKIKYGSFSEEWDELNRRKKDIEMRLQGFQTLLLERQTEIRKKWSGNSNKSIEEWIKEKIVLESNRRSLVMNKRSIEERMAAIKVQAGIERNKANHERSGGDQKYELLIKLLAGIHRELVSIHALCKDKK